MTTRFSHHRLEVYELACELVVSAKGISEGIPRGYRNMSDQLMRSASGVALLIAEGANRFTPAQKRQRFIEARGECGEAAATVEIATRLELVSKQESLSFQRRADRICAMLTGLIRRHG